MKFYEVRCPVHGFVCFNELEWDLINSEPFQRLRRIRQLGWTDYVYPGAMHTRFEHSLGVCHTATRIFDTIVAKDSELLKAEYMFAQSGIERQRQIIRLGALLHDIGHGPFSHAAEELMPFDEKGERYSHEHYSAAIVERYLRDVIENHPFNRSNFRIAVDEVIGLFAPSTTQLKTVVWREIISGQMDADRMDYLLRDSFHAGVSYGRYDLDRLVNTIRLCEDPDEEVHRFGVAEDGVHAVEGLIIARYMMFMQVYFHKTRSIYDFHYEKALSHLMQPTGGCFPKPIGDGLDDYLRWDDWRVLGELNSTGCGEHGTIISGRRHHRLVKETSEVPTEKELNEFDTALSALTGIDSIKIDARRSWYKFQKEEIRVRTSGAQKARPLSTFSPVVRGLKTVNQRRIYVPIANRTAAIRILESLN